MLPASFLCHGTTLSGGIPKAVEIYVRSDVADLSNFGVGGANNAWNSFEVDQKMRVAADLARRYSIASTPTIVVNGKYRTSGAEAGTYQKLLELIDELVARESIR